MDEGIGVEPLPCGCHLDADLFRVLLSEFRQPSLCCVHTLVCLGSEYLLFIKCGPDLLLV